jgi:uncharacterized C2H2 Zn-finger protein
MKTKNQCEMCGIFFKNRKHLAIHTEKVRLIDYSRSIKYGQLLHDDV